jgi:NAD+ synthase
VDFLSAEKKIEAFISRSAKKAGAGGVVLGLSGGIDSSVVAALAARALGPENVLGIMMPSSVNSPQDLEDSKVLAKKLGIKTKVISIQPMLDAFSSQLKPEKRAIANLMARIRMCVLYYHANTMNYLVVGTGNKSEISIGYFTKCGDGGCDILPIGELYKTQVRQLAKTLGIPKAIIDKTPTAGLWPGQTDEGEIGMTYEQLDSTLAGKRKDSRVTKMVASSQHKRKPPEVCKI